MARYFTAANAELLSTSSGVTDYGWPLTMACRFYPVSDSHSALFLITNAATTRYSLLFQEDAARGQDLRAQSDGGGNGVSISETGNWVQNTWNTAVGVFTSYVSRHVFLNGTKSTPDTSNTGSGTTWDTIRVGTLAPSFYMDGAICELAIWNVALTDQEAAEYHAGVCPLMIRPGSLKHYWPLGGLLTANDADYDIVGGLQLTPTNTPTTFDHPGGLIYPSSVPIVIKSAPTAAVITIDPGSYSITGDDPNLEKGSLVTVDPGSYSTTGINPNLEHGREVIPDVGSYSITGVDPSLLVDKKLVPSVGGYEITGVDVTLNRGVTIVVDSGSYLVSGINVSLSRGVPIALDVGNYSINGIDPNLEYRRKVVSDVGSYLVSGTDPNLEYGREIAIESGTHVYSGVDIVLTIGTTLSLSPGTHTVTGVDPSLELARVITISSGEYLATGVDAVLRLSGVEIVGGKVVSLKTYSAKVSALDIYEAGIVSTEIYTAGVIQVKNSY